MAALISKFHDIVSHGHLHNWREHIVADTLLPTQMFPRLPARATFVADTNFVSGTQKMFLILFRNILCPQHLFPSLRSPRNIMGNNVSSFTRAFRHTDVSEAAIGKTLFAHVNDKVFLFYGTLNTKEFAVPYDAQQSNRFLSLAQSACVINSKTQLRSVLWYSSLAMIFLYQSGKHLDLFLFSFSPYIPLVNQWLCHFTLIVFIVSVTQYLYVVNSGSIGGKCFSRAHT